MPGAGSFLGEVLSALHLDFACCNSESEAVRRNDSKERAVLKASSPVVHKEDEEEAFAGTHLPTILGNTPPTSPNNKSGPGSDTPTSASSRAHAFSLDLPMGQQIYSDPLTSNSAGSELSDVVDDGGARYRGQWLGDQRHGHGVLTQLDGERYEGQFRKGTAHGRGFLVDSDGSLYEGQWLDDKKHGFGMYTFPDGTTYEGQWADSKKHGTGSELWADGAKFEGQFADGFKSGAGIYRDCSGLEYIGQFRNDKMDGIGTYVFECGRRYSGHWHAGRMHGHGKMEWATGVMYEGGYENGLRSGLGTITSPDGSSYSGNWSVGKQHGKGVQKDGQGSGWQETWEHGTRVSSVQVGFGETTPSAPGSIATGATVIPLLPLAELSNAEGSLEIDAGKLPPIASEGSLPLESG